MERCPVENMACSSGGEVDKNSTQGVKLRGKRRLFSPLSFLQVILPILWTRGPGQMVMVTIRAQLTRIPGKKYKNC
jgi:hypothetical protein